MSGIAKLLKVAANEILLRIRRPSLVRNLVEAISKPLPIRVLREELAWIQLVSSAEDTGPVVHVGSGVMRVDPLDPGVSRELGVYHVHEPVATSFLTSMIASGMAVVDVGSNLGYYVLHESRCVGSNGAVVAIEPVPHNLDYLRANVAANNLQNVTIVETALGSAHGLGQLHLATESNWHSMILLKGVHSATLRVKLTTLDRLVAELNLPRVDLVRMDIEGYEVEVIGGMIATLARDRPTLVIELHPTIIGREQSDYLLSVLEKVGYGEAYSFDRGLDFAWSEPLCRATVRFLNIGDLRRDPLVKNADRVLTLVLPGKNQGVSLSPPEQFSVAPKAGVLKKRPSELSAAAKIQSHFDHLARDYYDIVDRIWYDVGYYHKRETEFLREHVTSKLDIAVDAGCGPGRHSVALSRFARKTVCVDISRRMLDICRQSVPLENRARMEWILADVRHLPLKSNIADLVIAMEVLEHLPEPPGSIRNALSEFQRVLRASGRFLGGAPLRRHGRWTVLYRHASSWKELSTDVKCEMYDRFPLPVKSSFNDRDIELWIREAEMSVSATRFVRVLPSALVERHPSLSALDTLLERLPGIKQLAREKLWLAWSDSRSQTTTSPQATGNLDKNLGRDPVKSDPHTFRTR